MPKIAGVNHLDAVRALEKAGVHITMDGVVRDPGLTVEQFKDLL